MTERGTPLIPMLRKIGLSLETPSTSDSSASSAVVFTSSHDLSWKNRLLNVSKRITAKNGKGLLLCSCGRKIWVEEWQEVHCCCGVHHPMVNERVFEPCAECDRDLKESENA